MSDTTDGRLARIEFRLNRATPDEAESVEWCMLLIAEDVPWLIARVRELEADKRHLHALIRAYAHHIGGHEGIDFLADGYESDELTGSDWREVRAIVNAPSSQEPA